MTIKDLYSLCDNLGPTSVFFIRKGREQIFEVSYIGIPAIYWEHPIKGFKIVDDNHVKVYL